MWKLLAIPLLAALLAMGSNEASALPVSKPGIVQDVGSGVVHVSKKNRMFWPRYPRHHNGYNDWTYKYKRHNHHHRRYYPYYRPYYRPYWGWSNCGWGYGYWPYGCYGGYYGYYDYGYYDRYDYPRRERVSNKKHVKWCKARYKTYNPKTDTFIGKGKKRYRCNSPYDGRR